MVTSSQVPAVGPSQPFSTHKGRLFKQQLEDAPCDNEAPV